MGAPMDPEKQPLVAAKAEQPLRTMRGHLLNPCGTCQPHDVAACCLAWKFPALVWGWNSSRTLRKCWIMEALKFAVATVGLALVAHFSCCMIFLAACGPPPMHDHGPMHGGHGHGHGGRWGSDSDSDSDAMMMGGSMGMIDRPESDSDMFEPHPSPECLARAAPWLGLLVFAVLFAAAALVWLAAKRRQAIREQFGIDGTFKGDLVAWGCCAPCALTQETRTLMHENVHGGLWHGPLPVVALPQLPATGVPAAQQMV